MKRIVFFLALLPLVIPFSARAQEAPVDSLALARQYTMWLYAGEADSLLAHSNDKMREAQAEEGSYAQIAALIAEHAGTEIAAVEETWKMRNGRCQYWRTAYFSAIPDEILIRWVIDPDGRIEGLGAGPRSQAPPVEAETCAAPRSE